MSVLEVWVPIPVTSHVHGSEYPTPGHIHPWDQAYPPNPGRDLKVGIPTAREQTYTYEYITFPTSITNSLCTAMVIDFRTITHVHFLFESQNETRQYAVCLQLELNTCLASQPTPSYGNNSNLTDLGSQSISDQISNNLSWHLFPFYCKDCFPV